MADVEAGERVAVVMSQLYQTYHGSTRQMLVFFAEELREGEWSFKGQRFKVEYSQIS